MGLFSKLSPVEKELNEQIKAITGLSAGNIKIYELAFSHSSIAPLNEYGTKDSNERLEYLGDAILGAIVAEYLFKKYPLKDEGFLTEIRARLVNRDRLNQLALELGLQNIIKIDNRLQRNKSKKALLGDAMEALIGAFYLDKGYKVTQDFVHKRILQQRYNLDQIIKEDKNYKSLLIEWSQKETHSLVFDITDEKGNSHDKEFTAAVIINGEQSAIGSGKTKKKAEQAAALEVCKKYNLLK